MILRIKIIHLYSWILFNFVACRVLVYETFHVIVYNVLGKRIKTLNIRMYIYYRKHSDMLFNVAALK